MSMHILMVVHICQSDESIPNLQTLWQNSNSDGHIYQKYAHTLPRVSGKKVGVMHDCWSSKNKK